MLSEDKANEVMREIEHCTNCGIDSMLNHLYELHKLRDERLLDTIERDLGSYLQNKDVLIPLWEMNDA